MQHRVHPSCDGERCPCGRRPSHKIGEQHPGQFGGDPNERWQTVFHELTAYVCCLCYSSLMGPASDCPLDEFDTSVLAERVRARRADDGNIFEPPLEVECPRCAGPLDFDTIGHQRAFLTCQVCGCTSSSRLASQVDFKLTQRTDF